MILAWILVGFSVFLAGAATALFFCNLEQWAREEERAFWEQQSREWVDRNFERYLKEQQARAAGLRSSTRWNSIIN